MVNRKFVDRTSEDETSTVQHLPFKIEYDGPANVDLKFTDKSSTLPDNPDVLVNQFRGRPLHGQKIDLVKNFEGVIATDLKGSGEGSTSAETSIGKRFDSFTYWNWDKVPSGMDKQMKLMDWLELSEVLHEPVQQVSD